MIIQEPGSKIKQIRELKNLSQDFLAGELGLSTRAYSKIESGETQLTVNRLNQIADLLAIDPIELLGFNEKQVFNNCKQEGNIGINHISVPEKLIEQYESHITHMQNEITFLRDILKKQK
jgi:transcriptional regulator with XRE-family HTH domain